MTDSSHKLRIGIYGGTFAPPHNGHLEAARAMLKFEEFDRVYVIPTSIPPHKRLTYADNPADRLEMLKLALSDEPEYGGRLLISDYEIENPGKSYTVLTLEHFRDKVTDDITFMCGADMFLTLDSWYRAEDIFKLAAIAYVRRDGFSGLDEKAAFYREKYQAKCIPVEMRRVGVSSSEIRKIIQDGGDVSGLVPEKALEYILRKNLYRTG